MEKMFTLEDAKSFLAGQKTLAGKKWEADLQTALVKNKFLPDLNLTGSVFKTTTFKFKIDEFDDSNHKKITDFYLPIFNHLIESKESISDSTEQGLAFSIKSLIDYKEYGDDFQFIVLVKQKPSPAMFKRLEKRAIAYSKNFKIYYGEGGIAQYVQYLKTLTIKKEELPMGDIVWVPFNKLFDNEKNRDINYEHVYDLMGSLLAQTSSGAIRGLLRTFIGFRDKNGDIHLVDAHHCKAACELINQYTKYEINEVPVYVLDHLSHLSASELTTLMSVINTLVLKWETFQYVKIWEKTFREIGDKTREYPYQKLRESMEDVAKYLGQDNPNSAPILQAFCLDDRADESNWKANTKKVNYGELFFGEETYENKLKPITYAVKRLANKISNLRDVIGKKHFTYRGETYNSPVRNASIMRAFATELSLQEKEVANPELYYNTLNVIANGYWDETGIVPSAQDSKYYETEDWKALSQFPSTGDEMKKYVEDIILPDARKKTKKDFIKKFNL
jgi:hypothetical protein